MSEQTVVYEVTVTVEAGAVLNESSRHMIATRLADTINHLKWEGVSASVSEV